MEVRNCVISVILSQCPVSSLETIVPGGGPWEAPAFSHLSNMVSIQHCAVAHLCLKCTEMFNVHCPSPICQLIACHVNGKWYSPVKLKVTGKLWRILHPLSSLVNTTMSDAMFWTCYKDMTFYSKNFIFSVIFLKYANKTYLVLHVLIGSGNTNNLNNVHAKK